MVTESLCTFVIGDQLMGLPALRIQEVLRPRPLTPVPLTPSAVLGLMNLRGQIVTAIDLRQRLGYPPAAPAAPAGPDDAASAEGDVDVGTGVAIVVETDDGLVSLLVDTFGDVIEVDASAVRPPPATLNGPIRPYTRGVLTLEERLVLVLDVDRATRLLPESPA